MLVGIFVLILIAVPMLLIAGASFDLSILIVVCMGLACGLIILATITWIIE